MASYQQPQYGGGGSYPPQPPPSAPTGSYASRSAQAYNSVPGNFNPQPQPQPQQAPLGGQQQMYQGHPGGHQVQQPYYVQAQGQPREPTHPPMTQQQSPMPSHVTSQMPPQMPSSMPPPPVPAQQQPIMSVTAAESLPPVPAPISSQAQAQARWNQTMNQNAYPPAPHMSNNTHMSYQRKTNAALQAEQQARILNDSLARLQESSHVMLGAMEHNDLTTTLDRAAAMLGELGDPKHHHHHSASFQQSHHHAEIPPPSTVLTPKQYYEIHMAAIEELPNLEEYLLSLSTPHHEHGQPAIYSMMDLYHLVQYCHRAVPRLYLQICAGSALIRSGEATAKFVLEDLSQAVKCVQCPIRGLFLRHYLLQAVKDKLPDLEEKEDLDQQLAPQVTGGEEGMDPSSAPSIQPEVEEQFVNANGNESTAVMPIQVEEFVPPPPVESHVDSGKLSSLMGDLGITNDTNSNDIFSQPESTFPSATEPPIHDIPLDDPPPQPPVPTTTAPTEPQYVNPNGTVVDSYQFVLANFIEMNKLWVRIQHLPGDNKSKDVRRKRERERNEMRILVGTNLVRLSELDGVDSTIYGTVILPKILNQIVACQDPLAQAYLMDCIIQVFPDEFHIQTLEVVLSVCPKLREKVNIRTILSSIMDRFSNYYADELLLNDEEDTEGVKTSVMLDAFAMFDECIRSVFEARGVKITAKEVIRLESSLIDFSLKCYPGRMDYLNQCMEVCASSLRGQGNGTTTMPLMQLDEVATKELEKLLSMPSEALALGVLELSFYADLLSFLPWSNRTQVAMTLIKVIDGSGGFLINLSLQQVEQLFAIIVPLLQDEMNNPVDTNSVSFQQQQVLVAKLVNRLYHEDTDYHFEMLNVVKKHFSLGGPHRVSHTYPSLIYAALKLLGRVENAQYPAPIVIPREEEGDDENSGSLLNEAESDLKEVEEQDEIEDNDVSSEKVVMANSEEPNTESEVEDIRKLSDDLSVEGSEGKVVVGGDDDDDLSYGEESETILTKSEDEEKISTQNEEEKLLFEEEEQADIASEADSAGDEVVQHGGLVQDDSAGDEVVVQQGGLFDSLTPSKPEFSKETE